MKILRHDHIEILDILVPVVIILDDDGKIKPYLNFKTICDHLGLSFEEEYQRIKGDPLLAKGLITIAEKGD